MNPKPSAPKGNEHFVRLGDRLVPRSRITSIDARRLEREGIAEVYVEGEPAPTCVQHAEAIDLVMREAPYFFEGRRFKWVRSRWAMHNLIAHPLLQICAWMGKTNIGLWIHDATIPRARVSR